MSRVRLGDHEVEISRTKLLVMAAIVMIGIIVVSMLVASTPFPWSYRDTRSGTDPDSGFGWSFDSLVQVYDVNGSPIMCQITPFNPGQVWVWDPVQGKEVEVGSFAVNLVFTLSGSDTVFDWTTANFECTFVTYIYETETNRVTIGTETVSGSKTGNVTKTVTVAWLDGQGLFSDLKGEFDYRLEFVFQYHASAEKKVTGEEVSSKTYTQTLELQIHFIPDTITITASPTVTVTEN